MDDVELIDDNINSEFDNQSEKKNEPVIDAKAALASQLIEEAIVLLERARGLMGNKEHLLPSQRHESVEDLEDDDEANRVVEGVFDGQKMVGPDGRHYSVPANYASKSKLVEGDLLKLSITPKGAFLYKQIGPIARRRLMGTLVKTPLSNDFSVKVADRTYRVLTASITYFHGKIDDEVSILVPENGESKWAAVENVIKDTQAE